MMLEMKNAVRLARVGLGAMVLAVVGLAGCHSHYVEVDVKNDSGAAVSLIEVDYPSASFGKGSLASGAVYHYRFKILGDGPTKILWTDAQRQEHTVSGPVLREGQEGALTVRITGGTALWNTKLRP
jgi:hypothetical protein